MEHRGGDGGGQLTDSPHVIFIADESMLPADHGGRLAMSNDVKALTAAGLTVSLIVSIDAPQSLDAFDHYSYEFASPVHFTPQRSVEIAQQTHPAVPRATSIRFPEEDDLRSLRAFLDTQPIPIAVIASRESTLLLGDWIATSSSAPLLLRSHNDEVGYLRSAAADTTPAKEARELRSEADRLKAVFRDLLKPVQAVALISADDASRYKRIGKPTSVVPALIADVTEAVEPFEARDPRAIFVGSLTAPHTAAGVQWFVQRVWPIIRGSIPASELAIAGRGASNELQETFEQAAGVTYLGRVDDIQPLLKSARVFVNPVFKGSGVNMKLAQPAGGGLPIVATVFGMRGAPALARVVEPSNRPAQLACQTLRYLQDPAAWSSASVALRDVMAEEYSLFASARAWIDFLKANGGPAEGVTSRIA